MSDAPKTLVKKLCEVMAAVGYTQKTGWNEAQKYSYATEADIAEKMRTEFAKRNIFIFPSMVSHNRTRLERIKYDKPAVSYATDVVMRWTIVDGDSGEERSCDIPGCSESPGDKGVYVAMTGSEKYLLMKGFLLPTGDDPESDSNEPKEERKAATQRGKERAQAIGEAKAAKDYTKSLFYSWPEEFNKDYFILTGHQELLAKYKEWLLCPDIKAKWSNKWTGFIIGADEFDTVKFSMEKDEVLFKPLKAA
jgi:hypothetical protein